MKKKNNRYTDEQIEFLRTGYKSIGLCDLTLAFNKRFGTDKTKSQIRGAINNRGITSGRTSCFKKGHKPWNAGTKGHGLIWANAGSFKKGNVPANRKPLGSERICSKDDCILIKVAEQDPNTGFPTRYKQKQVHIWEQANGPIPEGMVVAFRDSDKRNTEIENLMLISRAELLRLNQHSYKDTPDELKPSVLALSKLEVKTYAMTKSDGNRIGATNENKQT